MVVSLVVSQIILWIVVGGLVLGLLALARQVGVLHMRVAPAGALTTAGGAAVGHDAPVIEAVDLLGAPVVLGGPVHRHGKGKQAKPGLRLLMFVSASCPLCKGLIPAAKSFAQDERIELTFVGDDAPATQLRLVAQAGLEAYRFVNGPEAGRAFGVGKLPYAVLLDDAGVVLSKGLVNSREHLESLVIAHEMGLASVQEYIGSLKAIA